jgi:hypothetical protein
MSAPLAGSFAALIVLGLGCTGCARTSAEFTLDMEALRLLSPETTAGITYEESGGDLLVTVIDNHGDAHIHRLLLGDQTRPEALKLLRSKQVELEQRK